MFYSTGPWSKKTKLFTVVKISPKEKNLTTAASELCEPRVPWGFSVRRFKGRKDKPVACIIKYWLGAGPIYYLNSTSMAYEASVACLCLLIVRGGGLLPSTFSKQHSWHYAQYFNSQPKQAGWWWWWWWWCGGGRHSTEVAFGFDSRHSWIYLDVAKIYWQQHCLEGE